MTGRKASTSTRQDEYARLMWERDEARRYIQQHLGETHLFLHLDAVGKQDRPVWERNPPREGVEFVARPGHPIADLTGRKDGCPAGCEFGE